jgi:hypothetical protein
MVARLAWILFVALTMLSSARAADLIAAPPADCNCGSPMITVYDFEPGVVTRRWAECACRYDLKEQRLPHSAAFEPPDSTPFMDPWRRW